MLRIPDIFSEHSRTYSFELFPPKTEKGYQKLLSVIAELCTLKPDFISCTYGAGGGSREKTFDIVQHIQEAHQTIGVAHLTCVCHSRDEIRAILDDLRRRGICNILALRGDPPRDQPEWTPGPENFRYSHELCAFARRHFGEYFGIGVAGFPEGHPLAADQDSDARHLKSKIDDGADFVITQLFFNAQDYFDYVQRLRAIGVTARVIPGILPVTDYDNLLRFCNLCGATVTPEVHDTFEPVRHDKEKTQAAGIIFAVDLCKELLAGGAPGLHFYALNKTEPVTSILKAVREPQ